LLRGERVLLRALETADAEDLYRWHLDYEFSVLDGVLYPTSREAWDEFIKKRLTPSFEEVFLGIEIEPRELIGCVSLKRVKPEDRNADFGIAMSRERWDQRYGRDATLTLLRFAFGAMNLHRVSLVVRDENERARRMYRACGFREEGRLREARFRDGIYHDEIVMGILRHEFCETNFRS
jgi:RimJ/RimL family protein N-acetyltransferase